MDSFIELIEDNIPSSTATVPTAPETTGDTTPANLPHGADKFRLQAAQQGLLKRIHLPARLWQLLHKIDGKRDVSALAESLDAPFAQVQADCLRLLYLGVIVEQDAIDLRGFLQTRNTPSEPTASETQTSAPLPINNDAEVADADADATAMEAPLDEAGIVEPTPIPVSVGSTVAAADSDPDLLGCLIRSVREARGGGRRGELAVYLMLTRVPSSLYRDAGLKSFLYVDEFTRISHAGLAQRLVLEAETLVGAQLHERMNRCRQARLSAA